MATLPKEEKLTVDHDPEGEEMVEILEKDSEEDAPTPNLDDMDQDADDGLDDGEDIEDIAIPEEEDQTAEEEIAEILESRKEG